MSTEHTAEKDAPLALIREAATLMRKHGPLQERVADWLDIAGADLWAHGPLCECGTGCDACDDSLWEPHARQALLIAQHYLGRTSVYRTLPDYYGPAPSTRVTPPGVTS